MKTLLLSLLAYLCLFAFEGGYYSWFGIPLELVKLDATRFLVFAGSVASFFVVVAPVLFAWFDNLLNRPKSLHPEANRLFVEIPLILGASKFLDEFAKERQMARSRLSDLFGFRFGDRPITLVFTAIFLVVFSFYLGRSRARSQKDFLVAESPDAVVLRIYGDRMIYAPVNRNEKSVEKAFSVADLAKGYDRPLTLRTIGPLKSK